MRKLMAAAVGASLAASVASAQDREGYYYPPVGSQEVFKRELVNVPSADRQVRVRFVTQVTEAQLAAPASPRFVIFEKGGDSQHMIIVALEDDVFKTLYRARAVLAQLTANARGTEFFVDSGLDTQATWFDLAKILGFEDVVISDGESWSHRVVLE